MIRIVIADDQLLMRDALKTILEVQPDFEVAGMAENGLQALEMADTLHPDVILLDIRMPVMNGVECIRQLHRKHSDIKVIMLTTFNEEEYIVEALTNGASGYILKDIEVSQLTGIIRDVVQGRVIMPAEVASLLSRSLSRMAARGRDGADAQGLHFTDREREIIDMLVKGFTNRQIALTMFISEGTVRNYISTIYDKIGISDRTQAVIYFKEHGY